jgi:hypothetical protein
MIAPCGAGLLTLYDDNKHEKERPRLLLPACAGWHLWFDVYTDRTA